MIKKLFFILVFFIVSLSPVLSQQYDWVEVTTCGAGYDHLGNLLYDTEGNLYCAGFYRDSGFTIAGTVLPFVDNMDTFVAKFKTNGSLSWIVPFYGTGLFDRMEGLALDNAGNLYVLAVVQEEYNIGNMVFDSVPKANSLEIILMKFDTSGSLLWHKTFGGPGSDLAYGLYLNDNQEILLAGHFGDTLNMGSEQLVAQGTFDMFIASLDTAGNVNWAKSYGGTNLDRLYTIKTLSNGDIVVGGYTRSTWTFGQSQLISSPTNSNTGFLGKLSPDGTPKWAVQFLDSTMSVWLGNLVVDHLDNIYAGYYTSLSFAVIKYDSSGAEIWSHVADTSTGALSGTFNIDLKFNKIFSVGYVTPGTKLFGKTFTGFPNRNYILSIINLDGSVDTVFTDGGAGIHTGFGVAVSDSGKIAVSLTANDSLTLGGNYFGEPQYDIVVFQIDYSSGLPVAVAEAEAPNSQLLVYPNPARDVLNLRVDNPDRFDEIRLTDLAGRMVFRSAFATSIDIGRVLPGIYIVQVRGKKENITGKVVIE